MPVPHEGNSNSSREEAERSLTGYPSDYCSTYGYSPYPYGYPYSHCIFYGSPYGYPGGGYQYGAEPYYDSGDAPAPAGSASWPTAGS